MMFVPALGVLLAGANLKDMGWKPRIRKNIKTILVAWFSPIILTSLGAALYFLIFPGHFDLSGGYILASAGEELFRQMEAQGISYPMYVLINMIGAVTYGPFVNMILALGEEIGWRGFLYPQLKTRFGRRKGWILGGVIWGAWHWPLIWLIGYEYGTDYPGFPVVGMLLFCIFTVVLGFLCDRLCEKSGSIWLPSLFHGAVNAAAGIPLLICVTGTASARLLGPAPNGLISGLPFFAAAVFFFVKSARKKPEI
jgi:membrane protease YdiL (CAAX protease family)